jgi:NADH-quinone oxidoreductase subunit A
MPANYFENYLPLLIHFLIAGALAAGMVVLSWIIGVRKPTRAKLSPYECGMEPVGDARGRFSVKFYLVAMLFIIFDIEVVFMVPWAVAFFQAREKIIPLGMGLVLADMVVFMVILAVGYVYAWKRGALQWD